MGEEEVKVPEGDGKLSKEEWTESWNKGGWKEALPEDLSKEASLSKFFEGDYNEIPKAYVNLSKAFGDKVPKPKSTWKKKEYDEWNKNYNEGYPKDNAEYDFSLTDVPESYLAFQGENVNSDEQWFREMAHKNGLTLSQARRLWTESRSKHIESFQGQIDQRKQFTETTMADLKREYGGEFDGKMKLTQGVLGKYIPEEALKQMDLTQLPKDAWKGIFKMVESFKEGGIDLEEKQTGPGPNEMRKEIGELMRHPAYRDKYHPENKAYINKVVAINKKITGEA